VRGVGGSTILGSGEVALILDVPQLVQLVSENRILVSRKRESLPAHP